MPRGKWVEGMARMSKERGEMREGLRWPEEKWEEATRLDENGKAHRTTGFKEIKEMVEARRPKMTGRTWSE